VVKFHSPLYGVFNICTYWGHEISYLIFVILCEEVFSTYICKYKVRGYCHWAPRASPRRCADEAIVTSWLGTDSVRLWTTFSEEWVLNVCFTQPPFEHSSCLLLNHEEISVLFHIPSHQVVNGSRAYRWRKPDRSLGRWQKIRCKPTWSFLGYRKLVQPRCWMHLSMAEARLKALSDCTSSVALESSFRREKPFLAADALSESR